MGITADTCWMSDAACKGKTDLFFPEVSTGVHASYAEARIICFACPVRPQCLQHAFDNNELRGMWGGMSPQERAEATEGPCNHVNRCHTCDIKFMAPYSTRRFCSSSCRGKDYRRRQREAS